MEPGNSSIRGKLLKMKNFMRVFRSSEIIFMEGSLEDEMYIIVEGNVRITAGHEGGEIVLCVLGPGEFFGEMALVEASPRSATATALDDNTRLIVLDQQKFLYLVAQQPPFALFIMQGLCQRIKQRQATISSCFKKGISDR